MATIKEIKNLKIALYKNNEDFGIPQGTPISSVLSNLYLSDFDLFMNFNVEKRGGLYQRYSDDILIACKTDDALLLRGLIESKIRESKLELQDDKTDIVTLRSSSDIETFQYLGYQLGYGDARIRLKSLSRQSRTMKRSVRRIEMAGSRAIERGQSSKIFTKRLTLRFKSPNNRNFINYTRKSADELSSLAIRNQARRLNRYIDRELARLKKVKK